MLNLTGTRVLQGIFSRVVRVGPEPAAPRLSQARGVKPEPAPGASAPAPAPGPLAPSPHLVQALMGNNPTPPAAPGARLPQDAAVSPKVPGVLSPTRPISPSPGQNAQLQADVGYLQSLGASNIRVNQQQIMARKPPGALPSRRAPFLALWSKSSPP